MIRRARRDGREARGEERGLRKGAERKEKETKREEGLRDPPFIEFLDPTSWSSSIKIWFLQAYRIQKMSWCETE